MNDGPTVVLSLFDDVDFVAAFRPVEPAWSMFSLKHQVRLRLPIHSLRVAMTQRPDLRSRIRLSNKRVVLRHCPIVIQPQRLAAERIKLLRNLATRRVSSRHIQLPVWPKPNPAARMKLRCRNILDNDFAIDEPFRRFAHTHYTTARVRVRKINKPISAELRMQRHTHQTAFARLLNIRNDEQRLRFQRAVLNHPHTPGTL